MKLYFAPRTRATRARWLLEELGVPYELVKLDLARQENTAPAYLSVNPLGEVPVLVDGDVTLLGALAICLHLADLFPEKGLAPRMASAERGLYYQWMAFAEVSLEPVVMEFHGHARLPEERKAAARSNDDLAKLGTRLATLLDVIDEGLGGREFLVGHAFTAADVLMASILHLAHTLTLLDGHPRLVEYVKSHTRRPAVRTAVSG
ncbi:glutathione S-transferase family protein [Myxococcus llanfairpwllgwyngyllgogerychwyrndrobwllllantysiliogogogochensis]|uniref:Glutathione S-transferase family protein n=1 Tax=Myxococcus llanfairpwllgwyngyllgogerychwyrndrobwllllantysiliogogogochensis TaxID=2590453 RepID=A0A540WV90_9BACT|nr:glutathione S-transferase family protein [Myxococcus llanfairpwllgwyngyllgogerychwyrndrobwllllantysiliogogogochensis]TQF12906.1 glutathione S-transferase family protein [Myxococcus llanfairpwllgwyngyllgogerychwyrndrobwllllantysiliogogogochensis]